MQKMVYLNYFQFLQFQHVFKTVNDTFRCLRRETTDIKIFFFKINNFLIFILSINVVGEYLFILYVIFSSFSSYDVTE
jgi:tryptophan-rich sensory protein